MGKRRIEALTAAGGVWRECTSCGWTQDILREKETK